MGMITKHLPLAAAICASTTFAGGFDNSGQPFDIIFGSGIQVSVKTTSTTADIDGSATSSQADAVGGVNSVDAEFENSVDIDSAELGMRAAFSESVNCAIQIDTPYKTNTEITDDALNYRPNLSAPFTAYNSLNADKLNGAEDTPIVTNVDSTAFTFGCGYGLNIGKGRLTLFGGPKFEILHGVFSGDILNDGATGPNAGENDNIEYDMSSSYDPGYIAGIGYEIEEYAVKVSLAYHSSIEHEMEGTVTTGAFLHSSRPASDTVETEVKTPAAVNLNVQTGVMPGWLVFGSLRWANWSELTGLDVVSSTGQLDVDLSLFDKDTLDYSFGVGHQLTDNIALLASFGSTITLDDDSDEGTSLRQAVGDNYTFGFGGRYKVNDMISVNGGYAYTYIEKYTVDNISFVSEMEESHASTVVIGADFTL